MVRVLTRFKGQELAFGATLFAAATLAGCAGKSLDVGSEESQGSGGSGASVGVATGAQPGNGGVGSNGAGGANQPRTLTPEELHGSQWPAEADAPCTAKSGAKVGRWKGHWPAEGNVDVELHLIGVTSEGVPCGTVKIGDGPAPPPVTDADAIYPPSSGMAGGGGGSSLGQAAPITQAWPGYPHQMLYVQASASRLAFVITFQEILRPWCQLQPAVAGSFSCLPEWTNGSTGGPNSDTCTISGPSLPATSVPCFKMQYCSSSVCFCYDGACDVAPLSTSTPFELHWDGNALEGSINGTQPIFLDPVP